MKEDRGPQKTVSWFERPLRQKDIDLTLQNILQGMNTTGVTNSGVTEYLPRLKQRLALLQTHISALIVDKCQRPLTEDIAALYKIYRIPAFWVAQ